MSNWQEIITLDAENKVRNHWKIRANDIASGGFGFLSAEPLPLDAPLIVKICSASTVVIRYARVRSCKRKANDWYSIGVEFVSARTHLSDEQLAEILRVTQAPPAREAA